MAVIVIVAWSTVTMLVLSDLRLTSEAASRVSPFSEVAPLLPDLAGSLPPAPSTPDDSGAARHQLIGAVRSVLASLDRTVLVVEDLPWVDDATRELLLLPTRDLPEQLAPVLTRKGRRWARPCYR